MARMFDSSAEQARLESLFSNTEQILIHPVVQQVVGTGDALLSRSEVGHGYSNGHANGINDFGLPSSAEELPAEVVLYAKVPALDIDGAIFWHGVDSGQRGQDSRSMSLYFDKTTKGGRVANHLRVRETADGIVIGHPRDLNEMLRDEVVDLTNNLRPPTEAAVLRIEVDMARYLGHIQTLKTLSFAL